MERDATEKGEGGGEAIGVKLCINHPTKYKAVAD